MIRPSTRLVDGDRPASATGSQRVHELLARRRPAARAATGARARPAEPAGPRDRLPASPLHRDHCGRPRRRASLFGVGYAIGGRDDPPAPVQTVAMTGAAGATASLALLRGDAAGNWPMTLDGLRAAAAAEGKTYALWLTSDGKLAEPCGTFIVGRRDDDGAAERAVSR